MNEKIPVTNDTKMPIYVAGLMIPAGETRHFDLDQVPPHLRPQPAAPAPAAPADPLAELLKRKVVDVVSAIPALSDDDLQRLGDLEQTGAARKTLLGALAEELLKRADSRAGGEGGQGSGEQPQEQGQ